MGRPLAPRQGAALSAFAFAVASHGRVRGRTGFSGSALRAGTGPLRWVAEDRRSADREETSSAFA
jgi:hypothetical protein